MGTHLGMTDNNNDLIHPELYDLSWVDTMFNGTNWNAVEAANAGNIEKSNSYTFCVWAMVCTT